MISSDELLTPDPVWEECKDFVFGQKDDCLTNEVYPCALSCLDENTDDWYCQFGFAAVGGTPMQLISTYHAGTTDLNEPIVVRDADTANAACCPFIIITNDTGTGSTPVSGAAAFQAATCTVGTDTNSCT